MNEYTKKLLTYWKQKRNVRYLIHKMTGKTVYNCVITFEIMCHIIKILDVCLYFHIPNFDMKIKPEYQNPDTRWSGYRSWKYYSLLKSSNFINFV